MEFRGTTSPVSPSNSSRSSSLSIQFRLIGLDFAVDRANCWPTMIYRMTDLASMYDNDNDLTWLHWYWKALIINLELSYPVRNCRELLAIASRSLKAATKPICVFICNWWDTYQTKGQPIYSSATVNNINYATFDRFPRNYQSNLIRYHWLSKPGNSKIMHYGILFHIPYHILYWVQLTAHS